MVEIWTLAIVLKLLLTTHVDILPPCHTTCPESATPNFTRMDCETVVIRTANGPGGTSGPLRLDLNGTFNRNPMQVPLTLTGKYYQFNSHHANYGDTRIGIAPVRKERDWFILSTVLALSRATPCNI